MVLLAIGLGIAIWWFVIAEKYRSYLGKYAYARGANATAAGQTLNLTCDQDKEICVYRAVQICTVPDDHNFESSPLEPIASGLGKNNAAYGDFDPDTTVDMTSELNEKCKGQKNCSFMFTPKPWPHNGSCPSDSNTQLISTYSCIPKGSMCQSY